MRGEYRRHNFGCVHARELPPRARRIPFETIGNVIQKGTTSACAENTKVTRTKQSPSSELPPRARRILRAIFQTEPPDGTTSACAENTPMPRKYQQATRNYLRVRGEYAMTVFGSRPKAELPPRARRILDHVPPTMETLGTTSACAENTRTPERGCAWCGNYLRVRGEYHASRIVSRAIVELPPRARRIHNC